MAADTKPTLLALRLSPPKLTRRLAGLVGLAVVVFRVIDVPDGVAALAPQGPFVGETGVEVGRRIGGFLV